MIKLKREAEFGQLKGFSVLADGILMMGHRLCVPDVGELKCIRCIYDASRRH